MRPGKYDMTIKMARKTDWHCVVIRFVPFLIAFLAGSLLPGWPAWLMLWGSPAGRWWEVVGAMGAIFGAIGTIAATFGTVYFSQRAMRAQADAHRSEADRRQREADTAWSLMRGPLDNASRCLMALIPFLVTFASTKDGEERADYQLARASFEGLINPLLLKECEEHLWKMSGDARNRGPAILAVMTLGRTVESQASASLSFGAFPVAGGQELSQVVLHHARRMGRDLHTMLDKVPYGAFEDAVTGR